MVGELPSQDPGRLGKMDALVNYQVPNVGAFTIRIPAEGITPAIVEAAIKKDVPNRAKFINQSLKL
jgi:hypothetical protein